jgi:hypothetical protein
MRDPQDDDEICTPTHLRAPGTLNVFISDPVRLHDLRDFLQRAGCVAEQRRSHELEVYLPQTTSEAQARRELDIYLATWQAMNPGIEAYVVDPIDAA